MTDNPFNSEIFKNTWLKHFNEGNEPITIKNIIGADFYKSRFPGLWVNVGRTHTKGVYYEFEEENKGPKGKSCLIFDVPTYFDCPSNKRGGRTVKRVKQYPGFLIELEKFTDLTNFMKEQFGKGSRYKFNKYRKKLEQSFDINIKMYSGSMDKSEYDYIFDCFRELLEKRFSDKGEYNNNLDAKEWGFYKEVVYPMLLNQLAGLFVIFDDKKPIAVTLNYLSKDIIFDAITVFDIDYSKFHLGSVNIMYLIDWGITNKFSKLDFSKGYFDYKARWCTKKYDFEYHLVYDKSSIKSITVAILLQKYFWFKQYLREKDINKLKNRIHFLFSRKKSQTKNISLNYNTSFEEFENKEYELEHIPDYGPEVNKIFFEFLYLYGERSREVKLFRVLENDNLLVLRGKNNTKMIALNEKIENILKP